MFFSELVAVVRPFGYNYTATWEPSFYFYSSSNAWSNELPHNAACSLSPSRASAALMDCICIGTIASTICLTAWNTRAASTVPSVRQATFWILRIINACCSQVLAQLFRRREYHWSDCPYNGLLPGCLHVVSEIADSEPGHPGEDTGAERDDQHRAIQSLRSKWRD